MSWYLCKNGGSIYGPVPQDTLAQWAADNRVAPEDSVSRDRNNWMPAFELAELKMDWLIPMENGSPYGPLHLDAIRELARDGAIKSGILIVHRVTKTAVALSDAMDPDFVPPAPANPLATAPSGIESPAEPVDEAPPRKEKEEEEAAETSPASPGSTTPESVDPPATIEPSPASAIVETEAVPAESSVPQSWKELAQARDVLEREALKWKKMYEDEIANALRNENAYDDRLEEMRKEELASRQQLEQMSRKLETAERNYCELKRMVDEKWDANSQVAAMMESQAQLSQQYDVLMRQLAAKTEEIQTLIETRNQAEKNADDRIKRMEDVVRRERQEADDARKRALELEETHHQLLKSYRDLNERFIQMRGRQTKLATQHASERKESTGDVKSKVRLTR